MDRRDVEQLAEFCLEQLDEKVRAVGAVHGDTVDPVYMRDDLQSRYTDSQLAGLEDTAIQTASALDGLNTFDTSLGQSHAGMFVFEEAFMLLIPGRDGSAAYVSLDRSVSQGLSVFIKQCTNELFSTGPAPATDTAAADAGAEGEPNNPAE
jgi:hypothetical protein